MRAERQIAILATFALHHADDHALAIDVTDLETSQLGASHARGVERHQQRSSKQRSGSIDQARDFLAAQHRRQSALVSRVRQELAELVSLERLDEKESQCRYLVDHAAGRQLALFEQVGLIGSKFDRTELVGDSRKYLANSLTTRRYLRVVISE